MSPCHPGRPADLDIPAPTNNAQSAPSRYVGLWSGLREAFNSGSGDVPFEDLKERMLFIQSVETVRCFDEGVLNTVEDANIGSIFGIGFPPWTGGVVQYMNQYPGGLKGFVERARARTVALGHVDEVHERLGIGGSVDEELGAGGMAGQEVGVVVRGSHGHLVDRDVVEEADVRVTARDNITGVGRHGGILPG
jgi:hypothetical protein